MSAGASTCRRCAGGSDSDGRGAPRRVASGPPSGGEGVACAGSVSSAFHDPAEAADTRPARRGAGTGVRGWGPLSRADLGGPCLRPPPGSRRPARCLADESMSGCKLAAPPARDTGSGAISDS